jgi:hypothetical protein
VQIIAGPFRILDWTSDPLPPVLKPIRAQFSEWLWKKCNKALDPKHDSDLFGPPDMKLTERARVLGLALPGNRGSLAPYPCRASVPLASSESIDELRAVLERAPRVPRSEGFGGEVPGMVRDDGCWPEWDISYEWDDKYFDEVLQALIEVVEQHGVGNEGCASARWEVYDAVSLSFFFCAGSEDVDRVYVYSTRTAFPGFGGMANGGVMVPKVGLMRR